MNRLIHIFQFVLRLLFDNGKSVRIVEFIFKEGSITEIIDTNIKKATYINRKLTRIEELKNHPKQIDGLIVSGNIIQILSFENENQELIHLISPLCYVQEDQFESFNAYCKKDILDKLIIDLKGIGLIPHSVCFAPVFLKNPDNSFVKKLTATWDLSYSGSKLVDIKQREFYSGDSEDFIKDSQEYHQAFADLIKKAAYQHSPDIDLINKNRKIKSLNRFFIKSIALFLVMCLITQLSVTLLERKAQDRTMYIKFTEQSENKLLEQKAKLETSLKHLDSIIESKANRGTRIAFDLDRLAASKSETIRFTRAGFTAGMDSNSHGILIEGISDSPEILQKWIHDIEIKHHFKTQITQMKLDEKQIYFSILL